MAAGDKIGAAQARRRSAALGREYKSFCEKAGLTPRPERTRSMTGPTVERAKTLAKATKNDILRSTGSGDIAVTEAAIQRVPRVRPSGWDEESCSRLEEAHKELLRFVKGAPVGTEAAAVYSSKDMSQIIKKCGYPFNSAEQKNQQLRPGAPEGGDQSHGVRNGSKIRQGRLGGTSWAGHDKCPG